MDTARNPFPGLRAFDPDEDYLFFGREKQTDELRRRLRTARFLAVIGGSGSGKSSLVRSGLIPSLHSGFMAHAGSCWRIALTRPAEDPMGKLVDALANPEVLGAGGLDPATGRKLLDVTLRDSSLGILEAVRHAQLPASDNVLLVVDQFEELFRYQNGAAGSDAVAYVKLLLEIAEQRDLPVYVVLTMRAEYLGACMAYPGLPEAINAGQYLIPGMTRDEFRAAITRPVAVARGSIAPRLVVRLLNEISQQKDALPVLQHTLMRTWDYWSRNRNGDPIDFRDYEAIGTMTDALSKHADEAYDELKTEHAQTIARKLLQAITDTSQNREGNRRPRRFSELVEICDASGKEVAAVIEGFRQPGRSFLQPPASVPLQAGSVIDISHESLMRLWKRLAVWAREEARSTERYGRLSTAAELNERGEGSLWRNPELQIGLRWRKESRPTGAWAGDQAGFDRAMKFLDRSRRRRLLRMAALAALVLIVIGALGAKIREKRNENLRLQAQVASLKSQASQAAIAASEQQGEVATLRGTNDAA
jgi:hypothetical protein